LSNKLAQAESRTGELERTAQTALTNLALAAQDFATLSNRFVNLKAQLSAAEGRGSIAEANASQRAARITEMEAHQAESVNLINELRADIARITAQADESRKQIAGANSLTQTAVNERELLKARIGELEALLNNPEWLRAQLSRVRAAGKASSVPPPVDASRAPASSPKADGAMAASKVEPSSAKKRTSSKGPLEMLPDGSVRPAAK
jgi:chromosome segregation ATPase